MCVSRCRFVPCMSAAPGSPSVWRAVGEEGLALARTSVDSGGSRDTLEEAKDIMKGVEELEMARRSDPAGDVDVVEIV